MEKILVIVLSLCGLIIDACTSTDRTKVVELSSNDKTRSLYVKSINWGLTGDSQLTTISSSPSPIKIEGVEESQNEYVFEGLDPFVWEQRGDSIFVYTTTLLPPPSNFDANGFVIIQTEVSGTKYQDLLSIAIADSGWLKRP